MVDFTVKDMKVGDANSGKSVGVLAPFTTTLVTRHVMHKQIVLYGKLIRPHFVTFKLIMQQKKV